MGGNHSAMPVRVSNGQGQSRDQWMQAHVRRDLERRATAARKGQDSVRASTSGHRLGGFPHDLEVPPHRPRGNVEVVQLGEVFSSEVVAPGDLPESGDTRAHFETAGSPAIHTRLTKEGTEGGDPALLARLVPYFTKRAIDVFCQPFRSDVPVDLGGYPH